MKRKIESYIILGIAVAFIVAGIWQKQNMTVLQKAIKICLECVGIG